MNKIILTTGGTAGHIFPALAVGAEIKINYPECKIIFIGGNKGQERKLCEKAKVEFIGLDVQGFLGRGLKAIPASLQLIHAIYKATCILAKEKPNVVVGFGGYAAFPSMFAAKLLGIPTVLHEQNAYPGMANKILAKTANKVCLSLEDNMHAFPIKKTVITGNPVRAEFKNIANKKIAHTKPRVLILGGSLGAKAINDIIIKALPELAREGIELEHQTGEADYKRVKEAYEKVYLNADLVEAFIDDVPSAMAKADLLICRSGASTIAEITTAGKAAIFIPFPYATNDHQTLNANLLADKGAALLIAENKIGSIDFSSLIINLIKNTETLEKMSSIAQSFAKPDAAKNVLNVIVGLLNAK